MFVLSFPAKAGPTQDIFLSAPYVGACFSRELLAVLLSSFPAKAGLTQDIFLSAPYVGACFSRELLAVLLSSFLAEAGLTQEITPQPVLHQSRSYTID
ncbi:hypothetical protein [Shewanella sediminis]|uniref:hypothetical protein n=1 Tax=Shewanella sediminis TaxID=271097 RepID=UPI00059C564D|nr:hypothetical protein [Shewanella sediminis]